MIIRVTDLCGREDPFEIEECDLDDNIRDALDELSDSNPNGPWYLGEIMYEDAGRNQFANAT